MALRTASDATKRVSPRRDFYRDGTERFRNHAEVETTRQDGLRTAREGDEEYRELKMSGRYSNYYHYLEVSTKFLEVVQ